MSVGKTGDTGEQGVTGDTGLQGDHGERGDSGQRGVSGERGPKGDHGQPGDIGLTGFAGEIGPQGEQGVPGESSILTRRVSASFAVLTLIFTAMLSVGTYQFQQVRELSDSNRDSIVQLERVGMDGERAHRAICALNDDLERRIALTQQFLADHPNGTPGIPADVLRNSVSNQRQSLDALAGELGECPKP